MISMKNTGKEKKFKYKRVKIYWLDIVSNSEVSIDSNWYGGFNLAPLTSYVFVPSESCSQGDLSSDGVINIVDIISLVSIVINEDIPTDFQSCAGDLSGDGVINIVDIISLVNIILSE